MSNFSDEQIEMVWKKGIVLDGWNPEKYRLDAAGAMMVKDRRGLDSLYAWEIDHVLPKSQLEDFGIPEEDWDNIENLRPFNSQNNNRKSDDYPIYTRALVFDESLNRNIESEVERVVNEEVQQAIKDNYGLDLEVISGDHSLE